MDIAQTVPLQNEIERDKKLSFTDRVLVGSILKFFPYKITPNHITWFRFALIPVVLYFLLSEEIPLALFLFALAAFSDALDGALARSTDRVTPWGTLYDPLADKLLVGSVLLFTVSKYISYYLAGGIIFIEFLLILNAYYRKRRYGKVTPAHISGKIKMLLQSIGLILLLFYSMFSLPLLLTLGSLSLYAAVVFALISLFIYRSV